jgi:hypothetical protein
MTRKTELACKLHANSVLRVIDVYIHDVELCSLQNDFYVLFACKWLPLKPKHVALNNAIHKKAL